MKRKTFKKIVFCEYSAYGLDENHDVYVFDSKIMKLYKSKVKNIFGCGGPMFGIDLDGETFKNSIINDYEFQYLGINLKMEKMFVFPRILFGNATDGNTYSFWLFGDESDGCTYSFCNINRIRETKTKFSYHLKKMTMIKYLDDVNYEISAFRIPIAVGYHDEFYIWGQLPNQCKREIHCLGKNPREQMIKLLDNKVINEVIDNVISELLYGKKEFVIDCSGKKIDVKMIHNTSDIFVAADRDGKIYFKGPEKDRFIKVDKYSKWELEWSESPYLIKPKPKFTRKQQQDKLFHLLKNGKNCDLSFDYFY
jgi:hypothetical protein